MVKADVFDSHRVYADFLQAGTEWSDLDAAATLLEETKHSVLSECKLLSAEKSDAARETEARASGRYQQFVTEMVEARRLANRAKVRMEGVRLLAEMRRTEESSRRAEMSLVRQGAVG